MDLLAAPIALLTMPVMGSISDYIGTRFGRRKPFILVGVDPGGGLAGWARGRARPSRSCLVFFLCLQFTSNIARGPFAGLVPDLVPEKQVGIASGLMGLMIVAGLVGGYLFIWSGYLLGPDPNTPDFTLPVLILGAVVGLRDSARSCGRPTGRAPKPREGRSWVKIALRGVRDRHPPASGATSGCSAPASSC